MTGWAWRATPTPFWGCSCLCDHPRAAGAEPGRYRGDRRHENRQMRYGYNSARDFMTQFDKKMDELAQQAKEKQ